MEYYSAIKRNEIGSFVEMWMDLETVIQSEVKSEREKQLLYINAYMWNLEKWYRWTSLQGRNRDTDVEKKCMDTKEERMGGWEELGNWVWHIYTIDTMYKIDKQQGPTV